MKNSPTLEKRQTTRRKVTIIGTIIVIFYEWRTKHLFYNDVL